MAANKNCSSCGAPLITIRESCRYCGGKEKNSRQLTAEDENRIFWLLNILNVRLFRDSYILQYQGILTSLALNFLLGTLGFFLAFYFSQNLILAFFLNSIIIINPVLGCFKDFSNYLTRVSENKLFESDLSSILQEFMEGYNYLPSDLDLVLFKKDLSFIKRILIQNKSNESGASPLANIANNLLDFFEEDSYAESLKKTTYFFQSSGIIILLGYALFCSIAFFLTQNFRGFAHGFIVFLGFLFACWLISEQMRFTNIIFHGLGYNPNKQRIELKWNIVLDYLKKSERTIDELKTILRNDSKFVRLHSYLSESKRI